MKKIFLLICSLITIHSSLISAQTADGIIAKYINALGGKEKLESIKSLYMEGNIDANGTPIKIKYWIVNKKAVRYDYVVNGMTSYNIITNDSGWIFNPMMGQTQAQPMTPSLVRSSQPELNPDGLLIDYKEKGYKVSYKGVDDIQGSPAYKIEEKITDSLTNTYYIDTATYYIMRISTSATVDGKHLDMSRDFSNYQKTPDGYIFPMSMGVSMFMGEEIKFTTVKVNTDIDPSVFKPQKTN